MFNKITMVLVVLILIIVLAPKAQQKQDKQETPLTFVNTEYCGAVYSLSYIEYEEICSIVMAEAGGESFEGQQAVAQCILNTCRMKNRRPLEVAEEYGYTKRRPEASDSVREAVLTVFADGAEVIDENVTMFYSPLNLKSGYSSIHESQIYVCTIGGHRFFAERG